MKTVPFLRAFVVDSGLCELKVQEGDELVAGLVVCDETSDQLRKQGGFIPGVRPGMATATYIKNVIKRITLPGGLFIALIAVVPTIIFYFTGNALVQAFGGTSILIMIGVALDTMSKVESQLKMYNYDGFFK